MITGVRRAESAQRSKRRQIETCQKDDAKTFIHLIFYWSTADIWEYIQSQELEYCSLYDEGFKRLGCIGCPMATGKGQKKEFERWPAFEKMYLSAFSEMLRQRETGGKPAVNWQTGEDVLRWWTSERKTPEHEGQQCFIFE